MRMHARGRVEKSAVIARELERRTAAARARARHDDAADAGLARTREHCVEILPEGFMREVCADIDQFHVPEAP